MKRLSLETGIFENFPGLFGKKIPKVHQWVEASSLMKFKRVSLRNLNCRDSLATIILQSISKSETGNAFYIKSSVLAILYLTENSTAVPPIKLVNAAKDKNVDLNLSWNIFYKIARNLNSAVGQKDSNCETWSEVRNVVKFTTPLSHSHQSYEWSKSEETLIGIWRLD